MTPFTAPPHVMNAPLVGSVLRPAPSSSGPMDE